MIIGPDCGELGNIKNITLKLKLEKNVIFVGTIPHHRIKDYLGTCDIFVLPSLYEGSPLALLEAMAVGKAVIFTDLPCAKSIITDGQDGLLVKPGDVNSLARAILRLSNGVEFSRFLGANAQNTVKRFDAQIEAEIMQSIYNRILKTRELNY